MVTTSPLRERAALVAVPALLVLVALLQIGRANLYDQSSYAGFGFGMFATYENELSRWTEVTATDSDHASFSVTPAAGPDLVAQEVPTIDNIEALAESVLLSDPSFVTVHAAVWTVAITGRPMRLERVLLVDSLVNRQP